MDNTLIYYCDSSRHLVCIPYSIDNLHKMANELRISHLWFHNNHYDIPKRKIKSIKKKCIVVSSKDIVRIIRHDIT